VILQNILVGALGPTSSLPFQIVNNKSLQMFNTYHPTMICELVGLKLVKIFIKFSMSFYWTNSLVYQLETLFNSRMEN